MNTKVNVPLNILTFDIEEWFHILDNESTKSEKEWANFEYRLDANMDRIFSLLDKHQQNATFFCLGWVAREFPHILKKISAYGYEIATHSDRHQLAYEQTREEFRHDLTSSINAIEDATGVKVTTYRAPGFSLKNENSWVFDELIKSGITIDCSIFPAQRTHGGFEKFGHAEPAIVKRDNTNIKELPINLYKFMGKNLIFSGGGYFRVFPYALIKMMMKQSDYVMTYFHPRDFDASQPVIKELSLIRRFKSYYGLSTSLQKLEKLITDFRFVDVREANELIDWEHAKQVAL